MKKLLLLALCLLLSACALPGNEGETTPGITTVTLHVTTTPPETSPPETAPATTEAAEEALLLQADLPLSAESLREAINSQLPIFVLRQTVETEAGLFFFCRFADETAVSFGEAVGFAEKASGKGAILSMERQGDFPLLLPLVGYALRDEASLLLYVRKWEVWADGGSDDEMTAGFPAASVLSWTEGTLTWEKSSAPVFFPVTENRFYEGFDDYKAGFVAISAGFAARGCFSLLFDLTDPTMLGNAFLLPRVHFSYDEKTRTMALFCPNMRLDSTQITVAANDPHIQSARVQTKGDGAEISLVLKPGTTLYTTFSQMFERSEPWYNYNGGSYYKNGVLYTVEFAGEQSERDLHVLDEIVFLGAEN